MPVCLRASWPGCRLQCCRPSRWALLCLLPAAGQVRQFWAPAPHGPHFARLLWPLLAPAAPAAPALPLAPAALAAPVPPLAPVPLLAPAAALLARAALMVHAALTGLLWLRCRPAAAVVVRLHVAVHHFQQVVPPVGCTAAGRHVPWAAAQPPAVAQLLLPWALCTLLARRLRPALALPLQAQSPPASPRLLKAAASAAATPAASARRTVNCKLCASSANGWLLWAAQSHQPAAALQCSIRSKQLCAVSLAAGAVPTWRLVFNASCACPSPAVASMPFTCDPRQRWWSRDDDSMSGHPSFKNCSTPALRAALLQLSLRQRSVARQHHPCTACVHRGAACQGCNAHGNSLDCLKRHII